MRHAKTLTYRITQVPPKTAVLDFMQRECQLDDHEAYGTLNMGAGFALYLAADQAERAVEISRSLGIDAWVAGRVEEGPKRVVIEPLNVAFEGDELQLR
jgi:phosphoribosylformylglycinamidine cyclo-ligase